MSIVEIPLLAKKESEKYNWAIDKIYIIKWHSSISPRDLLNDTGFKAPYIIKNILENYDRRESFGYWVELGTFPLNATPEVDYLKAVSIPKLKKRQLEVENGYLTISSCELEPHEIRVIKIHPKVLSFVAYPCPLNKLFFISI